MDNTIDLKVFIRQHEEDRQQCRQLLQSIQQKENPQTIQKNILSFWTNKLQKHIHEEESQLFPFLVRQQFNHEYLTVLKREHETIRLLAERLSLHQAGDYLYKVFLKLAAQHSDFENEIVFRKMQPDTPTPGLGEAKERVQKIRA
jgi:hypothetical protein